jgi:hypothetical protein
MLVRIPAPLGQAQTPLAKQALSQLSYGPAAPSLGERDGPGQNSHPTALQRLLERKPLLPRDLIRHGTVLR